MQAQDVRQPGGRLGSVGGLNGVLAHQTSSSGEPVRGADEMHGGLGDGDFLDDDRPAENRQAGQLHVDSLDFKQLVRRPGGFQQREFAISRVTPRGKLYEISPTTSRPCRCNSTCAMSSCPRIEATVQCRMTHKGRSAAAARISRCRVFVSARYLARTSVAHFFHQSGMKDDHSRLREPAVNFANLRIDRL